MITRCVDSNDAQELVDLAETDLAACADLLESEFALEYDGRVFLFHAVELYLHSAAETLTEAMDRVLERADCTADPSAFLVKFLGSTFLPYSDTAEIRRRSLVSGRPALGIQRWGDSDRVQMVLFIGRLEVAHACRGGGMSKVLNPLTPSVGLLRRVDPRYRQGSLHQPH